MSASTDFISPASAMNALEASLTTGDFLWLNRLRKKNDIHSLNYALNSLNREGKLRFHIIIKDWSTDPFGMSENNYRFSIEVIQGTKTTHECNTVSEVRALVVGLLVCHRHHRA